MTGRRLTVEARRRQLLEVGQRVFSQRPFDGISAEALAAEAGVSKGLLFHHFGSKRGFYEATIAQVAQDFLAATDPGPGPLLPAMRGALERFLDFVWERPALYRAMIRGGVGADAEIHGIVEGVRRETLERIAARLTDGGAAALPPMARLRLYGWIGLAEASALDWLDHRDLERDDVLQVLEGALAQALQEAAQ